MENNFRNKFFGFKDIYAFTIVQSFKAKSMKIVTIILCLAALLSVPVISLMNGSDDKKTETSIKRVKVADFSGFDFIDDMDVFKDKSLYSDISKKENNDEVEKKSDKNNQKDENVEKDEVVNIYRDITYETADVDFSQMTEDTKLKDIYQFEENADYVYMQITYMEGYFTTQIIYSDSSEVKSSDVDDYTDFINEYLDKLIISNAKLTEDQKNIVNSEVNIVYQEDIEEAAEDIDSDEKEHKKDDEKTALLKYNIIYAMVMITMFALAFGGERVAMNIVTEKASKVMEFLLTSVKPMAIITGKVLASVTILLSQLLMVAVSFVVSLVINGIMFEDGEIVLPSFLKGIFRTTNFPGVNVYNIIFALIIFVGGFILFGLVAGLAGASVSKLEEMAEGVKMYSILLVVCAYVVLFMIIQRTYDGASALRTVIIILPVTSVFIVPAMLVTGYITLAETLISVVAMCVGIVLLTKFVSNVYESMVYYSGTPLKLKDIINISKQNSRQGKKLPDKEKGEK